MSEPQLVVELSLSQTEAISSTSSNTPEGKGTESVPYSAKEDVVNVCKTDNNISSEVTESTESDRGQGQGQGRHGKMRRGGPDREDILEGSTEEVSCVCGHKYRLKHKRQSATDYRDL